MELSKDIEKLIIEWIRNELQSADAYLGMSAAMESMVFSGVAKRMRREAKEGAEQGLKFFDYLVSRASKVELLTITQAATDYKSILHAFEVALNPKRKVTGFIDKM